MRISLNKAEGTPPGATRWGKRAGVALFLFFLIKGLAWIAIPAGAALIALF